MQAYKSLISFTTKEEHHPDFTTERNVMLKGKAAKKFEKGMKTYLDDLKNIGMSERTISNYKNSLTYFLDYLEENQIEEDPTAATIKAWRDELLEKGSKKSTVRLYMRTVSMMYNALTDEAYGDERLYLKNPVSKKLYPVVKQETRPYEQILTDEEAKMLYENKLTNYTTRKLWARNYAIVVILLSCELRNAELLALTPKDIDFEYNEIIVEHGKGDKYRIVDLPEIAKSAIKLYLLSGIRPEWATDDMPLFGTTAEHTKAIRAKRDDLWHKGTTQWLSGIVENHIRKITGVDKVTSHDLRHIGSRLDLNNGMRIEELQGKLGHSNVQTTQIYSGRLMQRRARLSAKETQEYREEQAKANYLILEKLRAKGYGKNRTEE